MEKRLYRNESDKVLGGVASGLADYLVIDVTVIRIAFLLLFFFGGSGFLIYVIMWIAVPAKKNFNPTTDYRVYEDPKPTTDVYELRKERSGNGRFWGGLILVILGTYFLFHEFHFIPYWFSIGKLWPLIFIIPGLMILSNSRRKDKESREEKYTSQEEPKSTPDTKTSTNPDQSANSGTTNPDQTTNDTL